MRLYMRLVEADRNQTRDMADGLIRDGAGQATKDCKISKIPFVLLQVSKM